MGRRVGGVHGVMGGGILDVVDMPAEQSMSESVSRCTTSSGVEASEVVAGAMLFSARPEVLCREVVGSSFFNSLVVCAND